MLAQGDDDDNPFAGVGVDRVLERVLGSLPASRRDAMLALQRKRSAIPAYGVGEAHDLRFAEVDALLQCFERYNRTNISMPMESPGVIKPEEYDVLFTDVTDVDLVNIGTDLDIINLSAAQPPRSLAAAPVMDLLFGKQKRVFCPLVLSRKSKIVNVLFLCDTGSGSTYLRTCTCASAR